MKRKYSNKYANKKQQGIEKSPIKYSKKVRSLAQMLAVATCISTFCGGGYISGNGERKENDR